MTQTLKQVFVSMIGTSRGSKPSRGTLKQVFNRMFEMRR